MESVLFLGWVGMFFLWSNPASIAVAVLAAIAAFVLEIFIDNNFARVKWQSCLRWSWGLTLACAVAMFVIIAILRSATKHLLLKNRNLGTKTADRTRQHLVAYARSFLD